MDKKNELYFKKAEKADRYQCAHKDELFSVAIGIFNADEYIDFANGMSKIVEWKELILLFNYFFCS